MTTVAQSPSPSSPQLTPHVIILVASHIYYGTKQVNLLARCLRSLIGQTQQAEQILVSISFDNEEYKHLFTSRILKQFWSKVTFKFAPSRKSQMQHIQAMRQFIQTADIVLFCDDDDTYHPDRVKRFSEIYCNHTTAKSPGLKECKCKQEMESYEEAAARMNGEASEFWAYGLNPQTIETFFDRFYSFEELLSENVADMYFRVFLSRLKAECVCWTPSVPLYQYNTNNPDSICAQMEKYKAKVINRRQNPSLYAQLVHDQLLLCTIVSADLRYIVTKRRCLVTDNMEKILFPERQMVLKVCDKLYDIKINDISDNLFI
eukprot:228798_1